MACAERKDVLCDLVSGIVHDGCLYDLYTGGSEGFGLSYVLSCAVGGGMAALLLGMFMNGIYNLKRQGYEKKTVPESTVILLGFTLYSVAVYAYFIPRTDMSSRHIWATMALNA